MQGERGGAASNEPTASGRMGRIVSQAESVTTTASAVVEPLHPVTLGYGHDKKIPPVTKAAGGIKNQGWENLFQDDPYYK